METAVVGFFLALAAGSMDGFTFFSASTFSTVQSGNVVQVGYWIANDDMDKLVDVSISILAFGVGAAFMAFLQKLLARGGHTVSFHILFIEAGVLFVAGLPFIGGEMSALALAYVVAFLAGMQGNAFHKSDGMVVGNVAVTLNVQLAFNFLLVSLFGSRAENMKKSGVYFLVLLGFLLGGVAGGLGADHIDEKTLWFPAVILLALGLGALNESRRHELVDPRP